MVWRRTRPVHTSDADPTVGPDLAAQRAGAVRGEGRPGIAFSENPAPLGLPTILDRDGYWDPVMRRGREWRSWCPCTSVPRQRSPRSCPTPRRGQQALGRRARTSGVMLAWIFSGMFDRFPNLKIAMSEGGIGWIPYFLERAEQVCPTSGTG